MAKPQTSQSGENAELRAHDHVFAKLRGDLFGGADELGAVAVLAECRQALPKLFGLEERQHQKHEDEDAEAGQPVKAARDLLERANEPGHVERVGQRAGDENAMVLEPIGELHIESLESLDVAHQPFGDGAQRPGDHRGESQEDDDRHAQRDEQRQASR